MWNDTFNACVESRKYCSHIFACIGHNNLNVFTTFWYINMYIYDITRAYQYFILPYLTRVSFLSKYAYGHIQACPPHVYHVVHFPDYWSNVRTVTYRPINPVCTIYYVCLSTGPFSVVKRGDWRQWVARLWWSYPSPYPLPAWVWNPCRHAVTVLVPGRERLSATLSSEFFGSLCLLLRRSLDGFLSASSPVALSAVFLCRETLSSSPRTLVESSLWQECASALWAAAISPEWYWWRPSLSSR